jgi:hypothetical protein
MPLSEVFDAVERRKAKLVGMSASAFSSSPEELARQERVLGSFLGSLGVPLILGGSGAWPRETTYGETITSFRHLSRRLEQLREARRR